jgi:hypothetical protein
MLVEEVSLSVNTAAGERGVDDDLGAVCTSGGGVYASGESEGVAPLTIGNGRASHNQRRRQIFDCLRRWLRRMRAHTNIDGIVKGRVP